MKRFPDWPERLAAFIEERRRDPFAWGERDCVAVANDWVEACTGDRVFHVEHADEAGATAAIQAMGGLEAAVTRFLGAPMSNAMKMHRGDVVLFESDRGPALGVCIGAEFVSQGKRGLVSYPITAVLRAWSVGNA